MKRGIKLAVGQPATGIGGIFYIILLIGILLNKVLIKICSLLKLNAPKETLKKIKQRIPTVTLVMCIILLIYMNITGSRLVVFSGTGNTTIPTIDLGITGPSAVSVFFLILLLFYRKAKQ